MENYKKHPIIVNTSAIPNMTENQARYFAKSIFSDIKKYIKEHQLEFQEWKTD